MKAYTMTTSRLTEFGNQTKEVFLERMVHEKIITEEQMDNMNGYCFVIAEKNFFGKIWNKVFWKNDDDDMTIAIVKIIN